MLKHYHRVFISEISNYIYLKLGTPQRLLSKKLLYYLSDIMVLIQIMY